MKADIKLSTFSYSVVNLHVCSCVFKPLFGPRACGAAPSRPVLLQFTPCRRVDCILRMVAFKSFICVQRKFNQVHSNHATSIYTSLMHSDENLKETWTVLRQNRPHAGLCLRTMLNAYVKHSTGATASMLDEQVKN
jgi:hypothetical protein